MNQFGNDIWQAGPPTSALAPPGRPKVEGVETAALVDQPTIKDKFHG